MKSVPFLALTNVSGKKYSGPFFRFGPLCSNLRPAALEGILDNINLGKIVEQ